MFTQRILNLSFQQIVWLLFGFILTLSALIRCDSKPDSPIPKPIEKVKPDSVKFSYQTEEQTFGNCEDDFCYQLLIQYPEIQSDKFPGLQEKIIRDLVYWKSEPVKGEGSIDSLIYEQQMIYLETVESELTMGQNWYMNISAHVDFNLSNMLSYTVTKDAFTGGAHPVYESVLVSLDLSSDTVKSLIWQDLFEEDRLEALREYVRIHFFEFHGLDYSKPVNEQGFWFEAGEFTLNQNFSIQSDGIAVLYNHYEVAPYSTGPTSLFLPWEDIKSWLKPEYKARLFN